MESIMSSVLIFLVIIVALFFLLREVMCWYYKINDIVKLQEDQLQLQKTTVQLLEKLVMANKGSSFADTIVNEAKETTDNKVNLNILTDEENKTVNSMVPMLKLNELIVLNTISRIIKPLYKSEFTPGRNWIIVKEFGK